MEKSRLQREKNSTSTKSSTFFESAIQKKLSVGSANDAYEAEADSMADKVMRLAEPSQDSITPAGQSVQKCDCDKEDTIQRKSLSDDITPLIQRTSYGKGSGSTAPSHVENNINSSRGGGSIMDNSTRNFMESRFGADFSNVRIHTGSQAVQMSRELNAQAFTVGNDIYFNQGKYAPGSDNGKHLLAHELTHTLQQGGIKRKMIQKSCSDGNCDTCGGGIRTLTITVFFRIVANRANMTRIRALLREAKNDFNRCCVKLNILFNWRLLSGGGTFNPGVARPAGDPNGGWDYDAAAETLGEGHTFDGVRGIPVVFVDNTPGTGGGVTMDSRYDSQYTGRTYMAVSVNQADAIASTFAHEMGHVAGIEHDASLPDANIMNTGTDIDARFCNAVRSITP